MNIKVVWYCLFGLLLSVVYITNNSVHAQELKGRVLDENNQPVYRAHIQLLREGVLKARTFTNHKGNYHFWPVGIGGYQALITVNGSDRLLQNIDIKVIDTVRIDFVLHKSKKKTASIQ